MLSVPRCTHRQPSPSCELRSGDANCTAGLEQREDLVAAHLREPPLWNAPRGGHRIAGQLDALVLPGLWTGTGERHADQDCRSSREGHGRCAPGVVRTDRRRTKRHRVDRPAGYRVDRYEGLSPRSRHRGRDPAGAAAPRIGAVRRPLATGPPAVAHRRRLHVLRVADPGQWNARAVLRLRPADVASRILRIGHGG